MSHILNSCRTSDVTGLFNNMPKKIFRLLIKETDSTLILDHRQMLNFVFFGFLKEPYKVLFLSFKIFKIVMKNFQQCKARSKFHF